MIHPVILVGGSGTRMWPMSRASYPKQFLPLTSESSTLQETVLRLRGIEGLANPTIVCNNEQRFLTAENLREIGAAPRVLILEPAARNTAPAITAAALHVAAEDPDALLLVLPSDHVIGDVAGFHAAVALACETAATGRLVTFGVVPSRPETGYGYVRTGDPLENGAFELDRFVEKPDFDTAVAYVASGNYLWNSGMFVFRAADLLAEIEAFSPETLAACRQALNESFPDLDFFRLGAAFAQSPSLPIDIAVMEQTRKGAVVPIDVGWNDIGSWAALWEILPKDARGNVQAGDVILQDASNCMVRAEARLVAAVGVSDLVVIETKDAVLVARMDRSQDVKGIVDLLKASGRTEHQSHRKVYRPWGSYEGVDWGERFQVKRLTVNPGATLSLQKHFHRAEHWVVVSGTAEVTVGETVRLLSENESIYIPLGATHQLSNPGRIPLHLVEVQSGAYLGEDDIVRFEDIYGRKGE